MKPGTELLRSWDLPVVQAIAAITALPGVPPDRLRWNGFCFRGRGPGTHMNSVTLCAYLPGAAGFVRFAATAEALMVTDPHRRHLSLTALAAMIKLPVGTTTQVVDILRRGLVQALSEYNCSHGEPVAIAAQRSPGPGVDRNRPRGLTD
ncbi:hypothetical protein [Microlunatus sp. GCM10028923]|uniref:hypothetical protein n=1 Tax=Microlunatus sp. GCM10028923 TaxID=3273400 RepID=UPI00361B6AE4